LPGKKQAVSAKLKSWQLTIAVVSGVAVIVGGVGVFAYQSYTQAQISAVAAAESSIEFGEQSIKDITDLIDELELAIRNSEESLVNTEGQTLDENERDSLLAEIEISKEIWVEQKTKLLELEAAVKDLRTQLAESTPLTETLQLLSGEIRQIANSEWSKSVNAIISLGEKISSVITAQAAWQEEQDRIIAAEAAARMAKAKAVPAVSTITDDGGASAVTAPEAPPENAPPKTGPTTELFLASVAQARIDGVSARSFIESYILALAPNVVFDWSNTRLCNGYYICGRAVVGITQSYFDEKYLAAGLPAPTLPTGFSVNQVVEILLDPRLEEVYLDEDGIGRFVLVHEAAHARQWLKYGGNIVSANEGYTGPSGVKGTAAVEYMADCMSISYLGYFVEGSYTTSCTPEQLAAANSTW
jgi:hypothetical protein